MHSHSQIGDPRAGARLYAAAQRLREALAAPAGEAELPVVAAAAAQVARELLPDANPRTRSQARGLMMVAALAGQGRREDARELLEGELWRSFPGHVDPGPG